jgi:hypothetical protein
MSVTSRRNLEEDYSLRSKIMAVSWAGGGLAVVDTPSVVRRLSLIAEGPREGSRPVHNGLLRRTFRQNKRCIVSVGRAHDAASPQAR